MSGEMGGGPGLVAQLREQLLILGPRGCGGWGIKVRLHAVDERREPGRVDWAAQWDSGQGRIVTIQLVLLPPAGGTQACGGLGTCQSATRTGSHAPWPAQVHRRLWARGCRWGLPGPAGTKLSPAASLCRQTVCWWTCCLSDQPWEPCERWVPPRYF